jgi:hypothetical protein
MNKILKEDNFEKISGFFRSLNKGVLTLYEDKIIWNGREKLTINMNIIKNASIGNWNGNQVLDIDIEKENKLRFWPYKQVGYFTGTDNSYLLIERWIKLIDKIRFEEYGNKVKNELSAIEVLKIRFAKGEITIEQFDEMKKILEN